MPTLLTIGYGNTKPEDFKGHLMMLDINWVVDIRGGENARIAPYRPGLKIKKFLEPSFNYLWLKELGNPFRPPKGANLKTRHEYILRYKSWLYGEGKQAFYDLKKRLLFCTQSKIILMCCESKAIIDGMYNCHRAVLAEELGKGLNKTLAHIPQNYGQWLIYNYYEGA